MRQMRWWLATWALATACTDTGGKDDTDGVSAPALPDATLTPRDPRTDDTLAIELLSPPTDPDGGLVTLRTRWSVNGYVEPELADAMEVPPSFTEKDERWEVVLVAVDDEGLESAPLELDADIDNTPPEVSLSLDPAAPTALDALTLVVDASDEDDDDLETTITWTVDGVAQPEWDGRTTIPAESTARHQRWKATVIADDEDDTSDPASLEVTIGDSPPTVTSASIGPGTVREADTITGTATATDPEGDTVTYTWTWRVNGVDVAGVTTGSLTGAHFAKGDTVTAEAVAVSAEGGRSVGFPTNSVTVVNTAPALLGASVTPGAGDESTVFSCTASGLTDADAADTLSTTVEWLVGGSPVATTATLGGGSFVRGDLITCRLTPTDGSATGGSVTSPAVTIGNAAPTLGSLALGPAGTTVTGTLTATPGAATDLDGDPVTLRYAWRVNGSLIAETGATLHAPAFERGDSVTVQVTPNDGRTDGATLSSSAVVIANSPPIVTNVTLAPAFADAFHDVTASVVSTDADGDTVTPHYAWTVDGAPRGTDSATLPKATFSRGAVVEVTVTGVDGHGGTSAPVTAVRTIGNASPVGGTSELGPIDPLSTDSLTCEATSPGTDPDGDPLQYAFVWYANGVAVRTDPAQPTMSSVLDAALTTVGETWTCYAYACDATLCGAGSASNPVTVRPVSCFTHASDDGTGACACNLGYWWCDETESSCCLAPTTFDVTVSSAQIAATKANGSTWDSVLFTDPDVYVEVYVDSVFKGTTQVADDDLTPAWSEVFPSVTINTRSTISFYFYDEDTFGSEYIGGFSMTYADIIPLVDGGSYFVEGTNVRSFTFRFDTP